MTLRGIRVDDGELRAALDAIARRAADLRPMLHDIAGAVESSTQRRFVTGQGPGGGPWTPLSPRTRFMRARRAAGGKVYTKDRRRTTAAFTRAYLGDMQPLLDTGRLRASITSVVLPREALVGSNLVYARIHQFGGQAGRKRRTRIPARPFLGISEDDRNEILSMCRAHIQAASRRIRP